MMCILCRSSVNLYKFIKKKQLLNLNRAYELSSLESIHTNTERSRQTYKGFTVY